MFRLTYLCPKLWVSSRQAVFKTGSFGTQKFHMDSWEVQQPQSQVTDSCPVLCPSLSQKIRSLPGNFPVPQFEKQVFFGGESSNKMAKWAPYCSKHDRACYCMSPMNIHVFLTKTSIHSGLSIFSYDFPIKTSHFVKLFPAKHLIYRQVPVAGSPVGVCRHLLQDNNAECHPSDPFYQSLGSNKYIS